jgi:hypothetical protein
MKMTVHEIVLIAVVLTILLVGTVVKHYRDSRRINNQGVTAPAAKSTPAQPPYIKIKKR